MKLFYTDDAVADLRRLRELIAIHDPTAAARISKELVSRVEQLASTPLIGSPVASAPVPDTVRDMVFGRYVVRYTVHPSTVIVLRIWHSLEGER